MTMRTPISSILLVSALSMLAALAALPGCASSGSMFHSMPNRMDGLFLEIEAEKPNHSVAIYKVTQDGTLSYAGGVEARRGETEWSTELSPEQRQRVMDMVEQFGWLNSGPANSPVNPEHVYHVSVRRGLTRTNVVVQGDNPQIIEMQQVLDEICMQRFDEYLERLPKPGEPTR